MNLQDCRKKLDYLKQLSRDVAEMVQDAAEANHQNYDEDVRNEIKDDLLLIAKRIATAESYWAKLERPFPSSKMFKFPFGVGSKINQVEK